MNCPQCNKKMIEAFIRPGRKHCLHHIGKYIYVVYDDGVIIVGDQNGFVFEFKSYRELTIEYIEKMIMLK